MGGEWTIEDDTIRHRNIGIMVLTEPSEPSDTTVHAHIGFHLTRSKTLWDCSVNMGPTREAGFRNLVDAWMRTTGSTIIELIMQDGRRATRFRPNDEGGFPDWHGIRSDCIVLSFQEEDLRANYERAVHWYNTVNPLPAVCEAVAPYLDKGPHGLKFFVVGNNDMAAHGDQAASVELDGEECDAAAELLHRLPSLELSGVAWVRFYCLLLFPTARTKLADDPVLGGR
jgi:hypothetical protein